jgi:repressor LexA
MANHWIFLKRQTICRFIHNSIAEHGWGPTFKEIGEAVGIGSRGHGHYHLTRLEREGYLVRQRNAVRALRLTEAGKSLAGVEGNQHGLSLSSLEVGYGSALGEGKYALGTG